MARCSECNSGKFTVSENESNLVLGAHYWRCNDCGNVMIYTNGVLIPTPKQESEMTQELIKDAAKAFGLPLQRVSINGEDSVEMQAIRASISEYINEHKPCEVCGEIDCICDELVEDEIREEDIEDVEEEFECDYNCNLCADGCPDFEERKAAALAQGHPVYKEKVITKCSIDLPKEEVKVEVEKVAPVEHKDYLLVLPNGEKRMFQNCSKEFMLNIINSIGTHIQVYELKELELKSKITYSF